MFRTPILHHEKKREYFFIIYHFHYSFFHTHGSHPLTLHFFFIYFLNPIIHSLCLPHTSDSFSFYQHKYNFISSSPRGRSQAVKEEIHLLLQRFLQSKPENHLSPSSIFS